MGGAGALLELQARPMTYCATCGCTVEISKDARRGWDHKCRGHNHQHRIAAVISEKQRDQRFPRAQEVATA